MANKNKFENQQLDGIQASIYGKTVLVTDAMKNYALEKISKIERLSGHILDMHIYLDIQKIEHHVSIVAHFSHFKVKVEAVTTDMYASIDKAVDKMQHVLRKWKGKIQDHHKKSLHDIDMKVSVLERIDDSLDEFNEQIVKAEKKEYTMPKIIDVQTMPLKTLNMSEAMMKLELSGDVFLLFRAEEDQTLKVMYRRNDGNYGVMNAPTKS